MSRSGRRRSSSGTLSGVSSATIRNDMAALEDEGYITQPHTSAGRVPTDKGYRLFVDKLSTVKPLSGPERRAIEGFLGGAVGLDDVVNRTVRLLAQLTRQVAVVQYPSLSRAAVRHLEMVRTVGDASHGRVDHRLGPGRAAHRGASRSAARGRARRPAHPDQRSRSPAMRCPRRRRCMADLPEAVTPDARANVTAVLATVLETWSSRSTSVS